VFASAILSLELQNVGLTINNQVYLKDINLCFASGAFNVLLGRTLAGKTSLMRAIAGLEKLTSGKILLNGEDITHKAIQKRNVSMVYQQFINYPHFTVWENIASPLKLAKLSSSEIKRRVNEIAELLHISPYLQRQPLALSGGQQQRCAMARALVKDSQLILFDEPLVNLDYKLRETLRFELKALFKQRNSIAIYATTEAHEALALGGSTTLLHEGTVIQSGDALRQYYQPANLNAANLYHEPPMNQFDMQAFAQKLKVADQDVYIKSGRLANVGDGLYHCAIRPDQVYLASTHLPEICVHAKVDLAEISTSETYLHVSVQDPSIHHRNWVVHMRGIHHFSNDQAIKLYIALQDIYVFDQSGSAVSWPLHASSSTHVSSKKTQVG
jgi:glycerol transport system ATP-binding protein